MSKAFNKLKYATSKFSRFYAQLVTVNKMTVVITKTYARFCYVLKIAFLGKRRKTILRRRG